MPDQHVDDAVRWYAASLRELEAATARWIGLVAAILDEAGVNYLSVTGRTKSVASFAAKASRESDGRQLNPDPLRDITDQVGVRVITYVLSDVEAVAELLADQLHVLDDRDMGQLTAREGRFGYASRHLLVSEDLPADPSADAAYEHPGYVPMRCASIQLRTVLQHAWAEFEHEIRYKGTVPAEYARDLDRRFTLAAGLLELVDREFSTIRDTTQASLGGGPAPEAFANDPRISAQELTSFLAGRYASAGWSRTEHYGWMSELLLELGIVSLDELSDTLRDIDSTAITERMGYRYPAGAVRRLDDDLLARFGRRYIGLHANAHRVDGLQTRLDKLAD
ncbi:MAG: GTP pyrophosphokinase [Actinomycetales bacterium]|nr:GTP pyrophosphokinase [Actinomycetales bacterium]